MIPSSKFRRSPTRTLSAIGFKRWSVIVSSLISNPWKSSNAPKRRRCAPEQQEQHTNIAVHGEKRSVQLAQIICLDKGVFVRQQRRYDRYPRPRGPRQAEAKRQPSEQRDYAHVHRPRDQQRIRDPETFRHGKKPGLLVVVHILAGVEHVKASDPQRNCGAENQHPQIEPARNRNPCGGGRNAQCESKKKMRPVREAFRERVEK